MVSNSPETSEHAAIVHRRLDLPASATMVALCLCWAVQQVTVKVALADAPDALRALSEGSVRGRLVLVP